MVGNITHRARVSRRGNGTQTFIATPLSGSTEICVNATLPGSTTNHAFAIPFTLASLQSIWISVDSNHTLTTNSTSSPSNTISLSPFAPLLWQANSGVSCPFTSDVSTVYLTNGVTASNVLIFILNR